MVMGFAKSSTHPTDQITAPRSRTAAASTVRTTGGAKLVHDDPYAESNEQLGGFYLIEAADLDAAIAIAKKVPVLQDGAIEIRPLLRPARGPGT
jgi:hypothetical protein